MDVALDGALAAEKSEKLVSVKGKVDEADDMVPEVPPQRDQRPKPRAEVKVPNAAEVARHNLTHLPISPMVLMVRGGPQG